MAVYIPADTDVVEAVARPRGIAYSLTTEQVAWLKGKLATKNAVGLSTANALRFFGIDPATVKETKQKQPRFSRKKAELVLATAGIVGTTRLTNKGSVVTFQTGAPAPKKPKAPKNNKDKK
jgi:hypothetical protein